MFSADSAGSRPDQAEERNWRNQRGYVSYLDLLSRTVELLRDNPHVRTAVQSYPVLMIDEFQDTDPLQAEMAFLLTADDPKSKTGCRQGRSPVRCFWSVTRNSLSTVSGVPIFRFITRPVAICRQPAAKSSRCNRTGVRGSASAAGLTGHLRRHSMPSAL